MGAAESEVETAAREVLAKVADILEPVGFQEEAELPAQILAEFVMVCARWELAFHQPGAAPESSC